MSTLKVNRIEPRTGDTVDIVGFGGGGRIVNSGRLFEKTQVVLSANATINNVFEWTITKVSPENNVAVFAEIGSVFTRSESTQAGYGRAVLQGYISNDGGTTSITEERLSGCNPAKSVTPEDNWVVGTLPFSFIDTTDLSELNLSFTATTVSTGNADGTFYVNYSGGGVKGTTTLTWLEFEGI